MFDLYSCNDPQVNLVCFVLLWLTAMYVHNAFVFFCYVVILHCGTVGGQRLCEAPCLYICPLLKRNRQKEKKKMSDHSTKNSETGTQSLCVWPFSAGLLSREWCDDRKRGFVLGGLHLYAARGLSRPTAQTCTRALHSSAVRHDILVQTTTEILITLFWILAMVWSQQVPFMN